MQTHRHTDTQTRRKSLKPTLGKWARNAVMPPFLSGIRTTGTGNRAVENITLLGPHNKCHRLSSLCLVVLVVTDRHRALHSLIAGRSKFPDRWICQQFSVVKILMKIAYLEELLDYWMLRLSCKWSRVPNEEPETLPVTNPLPEHTQALVCMYMLICSLLNDGATQ
jgi:hypothetical protein